MSKDWLGPEGLATVGGIVWERFTAGVRRVIIVAIVLTAVTVVVSIIGAFFFPKRAQGATRERISIAEKRVVREGEHKVIALKIQAPKPILADLWSLRDDRCGIGAGMSKLTVLIDPPLVSLAVFVPNGDQFIVIGDDNGDGVVDRTNGKNIPLTDGQVIYDTIVACIAAHG